MDETTNPIPQQEAPAPVLRNYTTLEACFAWFAFFAGYIICRVLLVLMLFTVTAIVLKVRKAAFSPASLLASASAIVCSAALFVSSNPALQFFSYIYALLTYCYFVYAATGNSLEKGLSNYLLLDYARAIFILPFASAKQLFKAMSSGKAQASAELIKKVLTGLAIAVLPTMIVLALLSYDSSFSNLLENIFDFDSFDLVSHIISLFCAIPLGMYIFGLFISSVEKKCAITWTKDEFSASVQRKQIAPLITILSAVIPVLFLYVVFFISQWQYYISGFTGVLPEDFSYAQYARNGFFELCTVSFINLVILLAVTLFTRRQAKLSSVFLKALSIVFSLFTLILIATAVAKLVMYINYYGLTPKRVYAASFMIALTAIFLLIIIKQFVNRLRVAAVSTILCVVLFTALSLCNADGLIARYNVNRYINGTLATVDLEVMDDLGDAAIPELVRLSKVLAVQEDGNIQLRQQLNNMLRREVEDMREREDDLFSFTIPGARAEKALREYNIQQTMLNKKEGTT